MTDDRERPNIEPQLAGMTLHSGPPIVPIASDEDDTCGATKNELHNLAERIEEYGVEKAEAGNWEAHNVLAETAQWVRELTE